MLDRTRPLFKVTTLLAVGLLASACGYGWRFRLGSRPMPPPPAHKAEACYHEGRIEVSGGVATRETKELLGEDWIGDYYIYQRENRAGLVFYRGGQRLSAARLLALLKDGALQQTYTGRVDELRGQAHKANILAWIGLLLGAGGLGVSLGSLGFVDLDAEAGEESVSTPFYVMLGVGGAALVAGIVLIATARCEDSDCNKYEVYEQLFVDEALFTRLSHSLLAHNRRVARRCGYQGPVDVPVPDYVKGKQASPTPAPPSTPAAVP